MSVKFYIEYDRPIHLEHPEFQTDHSRIDLPGVDSKENALAIIKQWKPWLRANKIFNIRLCERLTIETPVYPE